MNIFKILSNYSDNLYLIVVNANTKYPWITVQVTWGNIKREIRVLGARNGPNGNQVYAIKNIIYFL